MLKGNIIIILCAILWGVTYKYFPVYFQSLYGWICGCIAMCLANYFTD